MDELPPLPPEPLLDVAFDGPPMGGDGAYGSGGNGNGRGSSGGNGRSRGYERTPPHSLEAEVSVLGAALQSPNAVSEALETLTPDDFYRAAHRTVFESMSALNSKMQPVDEVTVLDWLRTNGRLDEVGGPTALLDLTSAVPTAANAAYYAAIVRDKALLRRLIDAGTEVVKLGYEPQGDARDTVDLAESTVFAVAEQGSRSDVEALRDLLSPAFAVIEQRSERSSEVTGLATGFDDLDRLTAGLQNQNLIIIAARPAMGKCASFSTHLVDAASGRRWRVGDLVADRAAHKDFLATSLGSDQRLGSTRPSDFIDNGTREVFRVTTRMGREFVGTANHPMRTWSGWRPIEDLVVGERIATPRRMDVFGDQELADNEVALLGYLIGDGCLTAAAPSFTTACPEILDDILGCAEGLRCLVTTRRRDRAWVVTFGSTGEVKRSDVAGFAGVSTGAVSAAMAGTGTLALATRARVLRVGEHLGYGRPRVNPVRELCKEHGLWGLGSHDKFVPDAIFTAPKRQVRLFLSRLFATDGSAWTSGRIQGISYSTVSKRLAQDVQHLLLRFGVNAKLRSRQIKYKDGFNQAYELDIRGHEDLLTFWDELEIFSKEAQVDAVRFAVQDRAPHTNVDVVPEGVWDWIIEDKGDRSWADVSEATGRPRNHNWHVGKRAPSRRLVGELAEALDSQRLRDIANSDIWWDEVVSIEPAGTERVYDLEIPDLHNFVADDIIVHNSSLTLNIAHYVTAKLREPVAMFNLEMSKNEIVERLLSAQAGIPSQKLRTGQLDDADWRRLSDALGTLAEAPLYIDDTPNLTVMEIRAKCRRIKQRHGLKLVIVDYLQLMTSHNRGDNRQQEVAEISRGMKMLAKELDCPVIALSQLSRQPESRTDKRPMLSDLRESGCLTRESRLIRADTGQPVTFGQLIDDGHDDVEVWASDARGRLVPGRVTNVFPSGVKPTFRVRMASGMTVEATANHPFMTLSGWSPLGDLAVGSRVATARRLPEPVHPEPMDPDEVVLLAHLIGEGTIVARQPVHYTSADADNLDAVEKAAWNRFGITARRVADGRSAVTTQLYLPAPFHLTHGKRNPIAAWLDGLGLWNHRSWEKFLPAAVFGLPTEQVRLFLHHLWATGGCIWARPDGQKGPQARIYYATSSPRLAHDVQLLLLRAGVQSRIKVTSSDKGRDSHHVVITGTANQRHFLETVGCHGDRGRPIPAIISTLEGVRSNPNVDTVPREVWDTVRQRLQELGWSQREFAERRGGSYGGTALYKSSVGRGRLAEIADLLQDDRLRDLASDDRLWDEIVEIEPIGDREVFDATVDGLHNFVCEGLILHNSIEQDADIVGFIYRDDVYNDESEDRGIAELIIAKHRNGGTGVVRLAFLNHLTKFANLARGNM